MNTHHSRRVPRAPVVMLTDFGRDSFYVGAMKAALLAADPQAVAVDLTHGVRPFEVEEASFILSLVFELWPAGSVFLAVVDPGVGGERRNIMVKSKERFVVGPDNGIVSDIAERFGIDAVFSITEEGAARIRRHRAVGHTFLGRDVFAPAAAHIAAGGAPEAVAVRIEECRRLPIPSIAVREGQVRGQSRYVDDFGNVLTNISRGDLLRAFGNTPLAELRINVNNRYGIRGVSTSFFPGGAGELMAVLDSWDLIELSVNQGRAVDRFAAGETLTVEITSG